MIYYLLLAYYIQCFRAYHFYNKTDSFNALYASKDFDDVVTKFTGLEAIENIWDLTSLQTL
jgi:hypothetical protein